MNKAEAFRADLKEGYTLDYVAKKHGVTPATVKRHASYTVGSRQILVGTEVHIDGERGRWEFLGGIGTSRDGEQFAEFRNSRTGRTRVFYTSRISVVHNRKTT